MIDINDHSFHDAQILKVTELGDNTLEFLLDFPVDWETNVFEHKTLKFYDVTYYSNESILFGGNHTILQVDTLYSSENKIALVTNAGKRIIEYVACDLIK